MPADAATSFLPPAVRRDVERWFVKRGVPQFIEGYGTEQSMDARAAPLITGWIILWTALFWFSRPEVPFAWNVLAIVGSIAFVIGADILVDTLRGRSPWRLPPKFDLVDISLFAALPVLPTLLVQRDPIGVLFSVLNILLGIGVIYIVIGFGLLDIAGWAADRLREQLVQIATLLSRTLPLLLILVVFLMFAAELWEAAHALRAAELAAVLALLVIVGSLLIVSTFRPEVRRLEAERDWDLIRAETRGTPAEALAGVPIGPDFEVPDLAWLERRNIEFVVLVNQLLQSTFVSLIVMAFLVAFGLIVVPASVQVTWIGGPVTALAEFELIGEVRVLSAELLGVSGLLSGIVGLYFTGLSLTDATYRADHVTSVVAELRTVISARALYRAALHASGSGDPADDVPPSVDRPGCQSPRRSSKSSSSRTSAERTATRTKASAE